MQNTLGIMSFTILIFTSCESDFGSRSFGGGNPDNTQTSTQTFTNVDSDLWVYFSNFEEEARARGFNFDLNDLKITGVIDHISDEGVAGTCQYGNHIAHVTVDKTFWNSASMGYREYVVFHELGHCVLHRDHREDAYSDGNCKSIMASGTGTCKVNYNNQTRDNYVDELFDFME